jgi:hypothetical protein
MPFAAVSFKGTLLRFRENNAIFGEGKFTALHSLPLEMTICGERKIAGDLDPSAEIARAAISGEGMGM